MKYKTLNEHYREKFGCKVYKLSLDGGFTCPNRDGTLDTRGCIFCLNGSGEFAEQRCESIAEQLERAKKRVQDKNHNGKYIAYFQSFSCTYADAATLRRLYLDAIAPDYIVGLSIGTRPDCLNEETIALLAEINRIKPVSVELGLQTVHERSVEFIRRGYKNEVYFDAVKRLREADIEAVTHIIIGLPDESAEMAAETARRAVAAGTNGVKFHLLHVLRGTDLEKEYEKNTFSCLTLEQYAAALKLCIEQLPYGTVVHRITGDGAKKDLVAPLWSADKKRVINFLNKYLNN